MSRSLQPTLRTGFGAVCGQVVQALIDAGHEVAVFGLGAFGETFDRSEYKAKIWAVGKPNEQTFGHLTDFLRYEKPDVLVLNSDIVSINRWLVICKGIGFKKPIIAHFVLDGLPVNRDYLANLSNLAGIITPTVVGTEYLRSTGIENVDVAPHGVDLSIFRYLSTRGHLRRAAGFDNKFVVGVFGRNAERKQQPRVLMALADLRDRGLADNVLVYLHCQIKDDPALGGWNLLEIAKDLGVDDLVIFPDSTFTQLDGVPYVDSLGQMKHPIIQSEVPTIPRTFNYIDRLNLCDLVVNVSYCGGFELSIIEAQACGVPVAVTNDYGIMAEVAGEGAILLDPVDVGIWKTGARQFFVAPSTISSTIELVRGNIQLQESLMQKGQANARTYSWHKLRSEIVKMVERP